jgi:hypothetical protein
MQTYNSVWRLIWVNFLRGLAFGLGSVISTAFLVYILLQILAQIELIPILGDWALKLIAEVEKSLLTDFADVYSYFPSDQTLLTLRTVR